MSFGGAGGAKGHCAPAVPACLINVDSVVESPCYEYQFPLEYYPVRCLACLGIWIAPGGGSKVLSPDGKVVITVTDAGGLSYSASLDGREVVAKSRLRHRCRRRRSRRGCHAGQNLIARSTNRMRCSAVTRRQSIIAAKPRWPCAAPPVKTYELDVRAYNDGVALRSRLAAKPGRKINGEATEWKMSGNPLAWYQTDFGSYEGIFQSSPLERSAGGSKIPLPITFSLPGGGYALVTEANLVNYSDLGVQVAADHSLRAYFHAKPERLDDRRRRGSAVARHAAGARSQCAGEQRPRPQSLPAAVAGTGEGRLDSARPFLVAMVVERRAGLFRAASVGGLDEATRLRVLPR